MKATGIVRRVDELGRVVLPKELRRVMAIKEGDPVEFYVEDGGIVIRKYNVAGDLGQLIDNMERGVHMMRDNMEPDQFQSLMDKIQDMKLLCDGMEG